MEKAKGVGIRGEMRWRQLTTLDHWGDEYKFTDLNRRRERERDRDSRDRDNTGTRGK